MKEKYNHQAKAVSRGEGIAQSDSQKNFQFTYDSRLLQWLEENRISFGFTTYEIGKVFLAGKRPGENRLSTYERTFEQSMGLASSPDGERLVMGSLYQLWHFANAGGREVNGKVYDKTYIPQVGNTTGNCDAHDLGFDRDGKVVFVNTLFSCIARESETQSFVPLWKPPFISALAPEDRCHLNGLAFRDQEPRYVTGFSQTDTKEGWREQKEAGGFVMDIKTNEVLCQGVSMPHSPRWYQEKLWVLNSGKGEFGYIEMETKTFKPIAFCPGYARGLSFYGRFALIGLSRPRHGNVFKGIALDDRLTEKKLSAVAGLLLVDLQTQGTLLVLTMDESIQEIYDVTIIQNTLAPMLLGFRSEEIQHSFAFDTEAFTTSVSCTRQWMNWIEAERLSLVLRGRMTTSGQAKLLLLGSHLKTQPLAASTVEVEQGEALAVSPESQKLYLDEGGSITCFENSVSPGQSYQGYDACFLPRHTRSPGDIRLRDLQVDDKGRLVGISQAFNALVMLKESGRIGMLWNLAQLKPEGSVLKPYQLTGLALREGIPRYVTAVSQSSTAREGIVIDVMENRIAAAGLKSPSSPRWHRNQLWLIEEASQSLGYSLDGKFKPVLRYAGQAPSLRFYARWAVLGVHQAGQGHQAQCKLLFINIEAEAAGVEHTVHLNLPNFVLNDFQLLAGLIKPHLIGSKDKSRLTMVHLEEDKLEALYEEQEDEDIEASQMIPAVSDINAEEALTSIRPSIASPIDRVQPEKPAEDTAQKSDTDIAASEVSNNSSDEKKPVQAAKEVIILSSPISRKSETLSASLYHFWQTHRGSVVGGIGALAAIAGAAALFQYHQSSEAEGESITTLKSK